MIEYVKSISAYNILNPSFSGLSVPIGIMSPLFDDSFHFMIYWESTLYRYDDVEWKAGRRVVLPPVASPSGSFIITLTNPSRYPVRGPNGI